MWPALSFDFLRGRKAPFDKIEILATLSTSSNDPTETVSGFISTKSKAPNDIILVVFDFGRLCVFDTIEESSAVEFVKSSAYTNPAERGMTSSKAQTPC